MKTLLNFRIFTAIICLTIFISSCKKKEVTPEEGFLSETGNSDGTTEDNSEVLKAVLHQHYDASLSKDDAQEAWEDAVNAYVESTKTTKVAGYSTEWFYKVHTYTGTQTDNETDGEVRATVWWDTDKITGSSTRLGLNNAGDDREGGWDFYLFRTWHTGLSVSWVRAKSAKLELKGTDGWYVKYFDIHLYTGDQSVPATGGSHIYSDPQVWLDNSSSSGWDSYYTGTVGYGTLNF